MNMDFKWSNSCAASHTPQLAAKYIERRASKCSAHVDLATNRSSKNVADCAAPSDRERAHFPPSNVDGARTRCVNVVCDTSTLKIQNARSGHKDTLRFAAINHLNDGRRRFAVSNDDRLAGKRVLRRNDRVGGDRDRAERRGGEGDRCEGEEAGATEDLRANGRDGRPTQERVRGARGRHGRTRVAGRRARAGDEFELPPRPGAEVAAGESGLLYAARGGVKHAREVNGIPIEKMRADRSGFTPQPSMAYSPATNVRTRLSLSGRCA